MLHLGGFAIYCPDFSARYLYVAQLTAYGYLARLHCWVDLGIHIVLFLGGQTFGRLVLRPQVYRLITAGNGLGNAGRASVGLYAQSTARKQCGGTNTDH
jgi:hypothetical protein